jgi:hypothetical protein
MSESVPIPLICDRCRAEGIAGDDPFVEIADLLTFDPVPRRAHVNGWTAEHQRTFVAALAMTGSARQAARALGRWPNGAEQLRKAKGGKSFDAACEAAMELYREREICRIKDNLTALAEQQEQRDQGGLVESHLRALPPASHSSLLRSNGEGNHTQHGGGAGAQWDAHDACPHCGADERSQDRRAAHEFDESRRRIRRKLFMVRRAYLLSIAADPERRAAWDLLCGPADWNAARAMQEQPDERDGSSTDLRPLREPRWQIPLKTGFAPDMTEPDYDPHADPLQQLQASIEKNDPRGSTERNDADPKGSPE